jgi:hypothetical protein
MRMSHPVVRPPDRSRWFPAAVAALAILALALPPAAAGADPAPGERPRYQIGYSAHRTNLPGGQFANFSTRRAFVVEGDGTGTRQLAPVLTYWRPRRGD